MGAKILTYFISLFLSGIVIFIFFSALFYHDIPRKTQSIKEYEKYINMVNGVSPVTICTRIKGGLYDSTCVESITINNKDNLINYINQKYNTDVLRDITDYNKKLQEYKNSKKNG